MQIFNSSASFTRPNNVTAYASGQLVANSATAGSVVPLAFTLGNQFPVGQFRLTRVRLFKSGTSTTNATFRLHLYQASPICANGDGGNWSTSGAANWLGNVDVTSMLAFTDGAAGTGSATAGSEMYVRLASGATVYGLIEARGAYTPAANEVFAAVIEDLEAY
jgi:hypothetical protein